MNTVFHLRVGTLGTLPTAESQVHVLGPFPLTLPASCGQCEKAVRVVRTWRGQGRRGHREQGGRRKRWSDRATVQQLPPWKAGGHASPRPLPAPSWASAPPGAAEDAEGPAVSSLPRLTGLPGLAAFGGVAGGASGPLGPLRSSVFHFHCSPTHQGVKVKPSTVWGAVALSSGGILCPAGLTLCGDISIVTAGMGWVRLASDR